MNIYKNLPLTYKLNNPWIYLAYYDLNLRCTGQPEVDRVEVLDFYEACEVKPGLIARWPDKSGGGTSFDELLGAAYFSPYIAQRILSYLDSHFWVYDSQLVGKTFKEKLTFFMGRFLFLPSFLKSCSNQTPFIGSQIVWCISLVTPVIFGMKPDDAGTLLRGWLMASVMQKHWLCRQAIKWWLKRLPMTPAEAYAIEPREYPMYVANAPSAWNAILGLKR